MGIDTIASTELHRAPTSTWQHAARPQQTSQCTLCKYIQRQVNVPPAMESRTSFSRRYVTIITSTPDTTGFAMKTRFAVTLNPRLPSGGPPRLPPPFYPALLRSPFCP
ncbi:hypothetical protein KCP73_00930 [Salmonella enterica subsp. enterica]|nr:hypothetical protein KCP73_00930 [Salmonella enterica subsp. enterica]